MAKKKTAPPSTRVDAIVRLCKKKYVRTVKVGSKWNTYLQIDYQGFCVVEQTTKKRAEWFGKMLAVALSRVSIEQGECQCSQSCRRSMKSYKFKRYEWIA